ncbi:MAG: DUF4412 domain-containing protein [Bacteroidales bacterium]|nr:MAG: DUF4412 domain-containing protein [Bacteroidales bacterium]
MIRRLIILSLIITLTLTVKASPNLYKFEGSIKLKKETVYDTSYVIIQVRGNQVRLDEFDSKKNLVSIYIINLESEKVLALSPRQKLFYELSPSRAIQKPNDDIAILNAENRMVLDGHNCCQMRVKSIVRNTEVSIWVTEKDFDFFIAMNRVLRKVKPDIDIFSFFPDINGLFPMLIVERTLLRKEKMKVLVTSISEVMLSDNIFKVPPDYQKIVQ